MHRLILMIRNLCNILHAKIVCVLVVSALDGLERFVSEMTCGTLTN